MDLLIANDNSIVFSDFGNLRIRKIMANGSMLTIAGNGLVGFSGDSVAATTARLASPLGLAEDRWGNIFFCDEGNNSLRRIDTSGRITTICGDGLAGNTGDGQPAFMGRLSSPSDVKIDLSGNIYISSSSAARIRMIDTGMMLHTYVGDGIAGFNGDGIPATAADLDYPTMMAFDVSYNLYFSDEGNNRIRVVNNTEGIKKTSSSTTGMSIFPNPVHSDGSFSIRIGDPVSNNALLQINGVSGIPISTTRLPCGFVGTIHRRLECPGAYFVTLTDDNHSQTIKIVY